MTQAATVRFESDVFPASGLQLKRYSPHLGATASGIDLRRPISGELGVELRQALLDHGVLFFQEQQLDPDQLLDVAGVFGTPLRHNPYLPASPENGGVEVIESGLGQRSANESWHADVTWRPNPPTATLLYALKLPPSGGDTIWTSSTGAHRSLHPLLAAYFETLTAVNFVDANGYARSAEHDAALAQLRAENPPIDVPVVTVHPQTGEKSIAVNELHTSYIKGLTRFESDSLLRLLFGSLADPVRHARFNWSQGSLAIWDNRLVQHRAIQDYGNQHRVLQRVTIA